MTRTSKGKTMNHPELSYVNAGHNDDPVLIRVSDIMAVSATRGNEPAYIISPPGIPEATIVTPYGLLPSMVPPRTIMLRLAHALGVTDDSVTEDSIHPEDAE